MNDWNSTDPGPKQAAARRFCELLEKDENNLRQRCKEDMKTARDTLREAGDFSNMPEDLPVYVFEDNAEDRGRVVALVLPPKGTEITADNFDIKKRWPCTWTPYAQRLKESMRPGDKLI